MDETTPIRSKSEGEIGRKGLITFPRFIFVLALAFMLVTGILCILRGLKAYNHGFGGLACSMFLILASTLGYLKYILFSDRPIDNRLKYLTYFQIFSLIILCITMLVVLYQADPPAPETCNLTDFLYRYNKNYGSYNANTCVTPELYADYAQCFQPTSKNPGPLSKPPTSICSFVNTTVAYPWNWQLEWAPFNSELELE